MPSPTPLETPLWGRDGYLDQLRNCWSIAKRGRPLMARVLGEPGMGKTALTQAFIRAIQSEAQPVYVAASPGEAHASYRFLDRLLEATGAQESDFGPDAAAVWHLLGRRSSHAFSGSIKASWFIAFRALSRWFSQLTDRAPALLILEDLHWVDQGSLEFLEYWLTEFTATPNRPLLLVVTERTSGGDPLRASGLGNILMHLTPLNDEDALRLVAHYLDLDETRWSDSLRAEASEIMRRAEGNPFFLTELLKRRTAHGQVPTSVRATVQARCEELTPSAQALLAGAAVAGSHLDALLVEALSSGNSRAALELVSAGFLQPITGGYRWSHELLLQAVYDDLDPTVRQDRHAWIAAFMQEQVADYPAYTTAELSRHLLGAGRVLDARRTLLDAAEYALLRYDLREGHTLLTRALNLIEPGDPGHAETALRLAEVELSRGEGESARERLEALHGTPVHGWSHAMAKVFERLGDYDEAMRVLTEALAGQESSSERAQLELSLAQLELRQGRYAACEQRASALLGQGLLGTSLGLAYSLMGVACYRMGRYEESLRHHQRALCEREAAHDLLGIASTYNNLGSLHYDQGDWDSAQRAYQKGKELAVRIGEVWLESSFENNLGNLALNQGDWKEAERCYRAALAIKERLGERAGIAIARCNLGNALGRLGRYSEARGILHEAISAMEAIGDREVLADLYYHLGMVEVEAKADAEAWEALDRAIELGNVLHRTVPVGTAYRGQSILLMRRGEPAKAFEAIQQSLVLLEGAFASLEHARSLGQAAIIAGALDHHARAKAYRVCAADAFERLGAKVDLARLKELA